MILDSSAVIAILRRERDAGDFVEAIEGASVLRISAANYLETAIVIDAEKDPIASRRVDELLLRADVEIAAVTEEQARIAREAYRNFGRGSGHPAKLNYGDCFAYALASTSAEPLLCKGSEFRKAGVKLAME